MPGLDAYIRADVGTDRILGNEPAAESQEFWIVIIAGALK
jgi:hypothetical protein